MTQNRSLKICMRKPGCFSVENLREEVHILSVGEYQIRLANEYLKRAKENQIEWIHEINQKKRQRPKNSYQSILDHLSC